MIYENYLDTVRDYRLVFGTPAGKRVFCDLIGSMGAYSRELPSVEALVLHNMVKSIMHKCGILQPENALGIIDSLFELPFEFNEKEKGDENDGY